MPSRARGPYLDNLLVAVVGLDALRGQGVTVAGPVGHHGEGFSHRLWATEAAARSGWPKSPGSSQTSTAAPSAASGSSSEAWGRARGDVSKPPPPSARSLSPGSLGLARSAPQGAAGQTHLLLGLLAPVAREVMGQGQPQHLHALLKHEAGVSRRFRLPWTSAVTRYKPSPGSVRPVSRLPPPAT